LPTTDNRADQPEKVDSPSDGRQHTSAGETHEQGFWSFLQDDGEIDLRDLLRTLWRQKAIIIGTFFISVLIAGVTVFQLTPLYTADAALMIDARKTKIVDVEAVLSGISTDAGAILAEVEILRSRTLAETVVTNLGLINDPEFNGRLQPDGFWTTFMKANQIFPDEFLANFFAKKESLDLSPEQAKRKVMAGAVKSLLSNLSVAPIRRSPVIQVKFVSNNPKKAALITNTVTQLYLRDQLEAKFEATQRATRFLNDKLGDLLTKVRAAESNVDVYRRAKGLIERKGVSVDGQQMAELNSKVVLAQADRAEAEARLMQVKRLVNSGSNFDSIAEVLSSPLIQSLRRQESLVLRKASELTTEYGERHPKMINIRAEYRDLRAKIEAEVRKITKGLENQVEISRVREGTLRAALTVIQQRVVGQNRDEIKLREYEREATAARAIYSTYLNRFNETSQQSDTQSADARIISKAEIPESPTFPKKRLILLLVGVGSIFLGIVLVFVLERLDNGFRTSEQIERLTRVPSMGMVPIIRGFIKRTERVDHYVFDQPTSSVSESIRSLKTSLTLAGLDDPIKVLCITSSVPSEGKSTVASWLAQVGALSGQRALIVDCDLRRPKLHVNVNASNEKNLVEFLAGNITLEESVYVDEITGVHMIFGVQTTGNPLDILQSATMKNFVDAARQHYDFVILDSPPILAVSDAKILSHLADRTIYLVKWNATPREAVLSGLKQLLDAKVKFAGILLSMVNVKKHARYGYGDQGYYYGRYKEYYTD